MSKNILNIDAEFNNVEFDEANINRVTNNKLLPLDPAWKANHAAGIVKRSSNQQWRENSARAGALGGSDEIKAILSKNNSGSGNPAFKGKVIGYNEETGVTVEFVSAKDIKANGFHHGHVYSAIKSGKKHKGYLWKRVQE